MHSLKKYNLSVILIPLIVLAVVGSVLLIFPEESANFIDESLKAFIDNFSWYYLLIGFLFVSVLVWLAASKYGKIKLGNLDKPRYTTFAWAAMIYTATMAADLIFFSFSEWMNYYALADTIGGDAIDLALTYPLFHFGPTPWAFYVLPAVAYAYWMYYKKKNVTKMSDAIMVKNKSIIKIVDVFTMISVLIAASVTLNISTSLLVPVAVSELFRIENTLTLQIIIITIIAIIYTIAVLKRRGVEMLAKANVWVYFVLFAIFLITPNILFMLESAVTGLGNLVSNFIPMSLNIDPARAQDGFVQDFTVFYWAYWISWAVVIPVFIGKISEGRTIRNMIVGGMSAGVLGGFTSFFIFGNYGLAVQVSGQADFIGLMNEGVEVGLLIVSVFRTFPFFLPYVIMAFVAALMIMMNSTTLDAMIVITAEASYKGEESKKLSMQMRIYWSLLFLILPIIFAINENEFASLQVVLILLGLPMSVVLIRIVYVFLKSLFKDNHGNENAIEEPEASVIENETAVAEKE